MANQYSIKGTVRAADGNLLSNFRVAAYDRDLRSRELLGEAVTGNDGRYEISYLEELAPQLERDRADIFIEIFAEDDLQKENVLAVSETVFNAPENTVIDVTVPAESYRPLSEYERLARLLQPLHEGLSPADLEENSEHRDITFLKGETGWDEDKLTRYVLAFRFSRNSPLPAQFWYAVLKSSVLLEVPGESLAEKAGNIVKLLPSVSESSVRELLTEALAENLIEQAFESQTEEWLELYLDFLLTFITDEPGEFALEKVLELTGISGDKREIALQAFLQNDVSGKSWVDALPYGHDFTEQEIRDLKTTFTLSNLAMGNFGIVSELKQLLGENDPSHLATLETQEWQDLVGRHDQDFSAPGLPVEFSEVANRLNKTILAEQISGNFRQAYPTATFAAFLERELENNNENVPFSEAVSEFLQNNGDFDLLGSRVDKLEISTQLKQELSGIQRVFKLTDDYRITSLLLSDNIHSAQQIYALGQGQFVSRYAQEGLDEATLKNIYARAANTHAAAMSLIGELKALENSQSVAALNSGGSVADLFPNWKTLFGAADVCECQHCRSVYSPGAYFADILMFLKHRKAGIGNVKDLLFSRRPDLGYLELSCDNANTELPYIDVVCEVLEEAVSPSDIFTLVAVPAPGPVSPAIIAEFNAVNITIAPDAVINEVRESAALPVRAYTLRDDRHSFRIELDGRVFELHQTRGKADELAAIPQYVNSAAYAKLKSASYPMSLPADYINKDLKPSLPFDLFSVEMRAYLNKHGIRRWELMQTLQGNPAPASPTDEDIAIEYFGISIDKTLVSPAIDERTIILQAAATLGEQRVFWGEPAAATQTDLTDRVGKVSAFLDKTGLQYNDLLKLLDLSFINPAGDIAVIHDDSSCDTVQKHLSNLDLGALDRMHRFLRLWRKLKDWQLWELNLVLMHPVIGNGALDPAFLIQLRFFVELKDQLEISVEETAGLFAQFTSGYVAESGISIKSKFTESFEEREPSFYEKLFLNKKRTNPLDPDFAIANVTAVTPPEAIINNKLVIMTALKLKEADLDALIAYEGLTGPNTLSLGNLSKLYRHAALSRAVSMKSQEYLTWLKVSQTDLNSSFASPQTAFELLQSAPEIHGLTDIKTDELNYVLRADLSAKAAPVEKTVAAFLTQLRKALKSIKSEYDKNQYEALDTAARQDEIDDAVDALEAELLLVVPPLTSDEIAERLDELRSTLENSLLGKIGEILRPLLQKTGRPDTEIDLILAVFRNDLHQEIKVPTLAAAPVFPMGSTAAFDVQTRILSFDGVMSDAEKIVLEGLSSNSEYLSAIGEMHRLPRLWVKFILPFLAEAPLAMLPGTVDFTKLSKNLADKISFDGENALLRFKGIMTVAEREALIDLSLVTDTLYRTAVTSLFNAPDVSAAGIWRTPAQIPPAEPDRVKVFKDAAVVLLDYFTKTLSETLVNQQFAESLAIAPDLTEIVLGTTFASFAAPLRDTYTDPAFIDSQNVIASTGPAFVVQFEHYYWLHRLSWLIRKLGISAEELSWLIDYNYQSDSRDILDFQTLPTGTLAPAASYGKFLNLYDLFQLQDRHSTEALTVFDIVAKLSTAASYPDASFGADLHLLHEEWQAGDVIKLTFSLNLVYRDDYVFVSSWKRLLGALAYCQKLNGSADSVLKLVNPTVGPAETKVLKELLRAGYSDEQWFELSKDVQNILRNLKRDSLVAYLLTLPAPPDNPSPKWENVNDLYAYYLLDVQMGDCLTTSRLVQASGSVQLFVQRCFLGLEPDVQIDTRSEGADLRWLQWEWLKKYQVWVANRKIFLYPENWIEPQLRRDKSPFFKDLENELQQNELNNDNVETAFLNYIDKLDTVSQLEIAGFYYEDAKDILHVFGRTGLADPHIYYYRRFDENRGNWSAWTKVDVDITGDYIIPTMINERLYIFWPVFTEEPEQVSTVPIPLGSGGGNAETSYKTLKVQMAVSEFRNNKWQSKKISKDYIQTARYKNTIDKSHYAFRPIDLLKEEGVFLIQCETLGDYSPFIRGSFEVFGCKGVPEKSNRESLPIREIIDPIDSVPLFMRPTELGTRRYQYFAFRQHPNYIYPSLFPRANAAQAAINLIDVVLNKTPGIFKVTRPLEPSFYDRIFFNNPFIGDVINIYGSFEGLYSSFFYADKTRTFHVKPAALPLEPQLGLPVKYYPTIKREAQEIKQIYSEAAESMLAGMSEQDVIIYANHATLFLRERGYPQTRIPADPRDVARLIFDLFANFIVIFLGLYFFPLIRYHFKNYYHPFPCLFARQVYNFGIDGLMERKVQLKNTVLGKKYYPLYNTRKFDFKTEYSPTHLVLDPFVDTTPNKDYRFYPMEVVDFSADGSYSQYNWELFYHAPLMIASSLSQNQRFAEAQKWFHYIFNPLDTTVTTDSLGNPTPQKFWITRPFFEMQEEDYKKQRIDTILNMLNSTRSGDLETTELEQQVQNWRSNPFEPHVVAQNRPIAYQKTVFMKYMDNLIAWGDQLFRQFSMESIQEATQLYIQAAELLGPRPRDVSPQFRPKFLSFNELEDKFDAFSNAAVDLENLVPAITARESATPVVSPPLPIWLYFCIPQNDKMLGYWDTVANRLYKIRHCMDIDGVVRKLSLFEPPIDPAALVNAIAGGASLSSALADLNAPTPLYRFNVMLQKANELCNDVKALGGALLSSLKDKDAEAIALLRQNHEMKVLDAVRAIKEKQIEDARIVLAGLLKNRELTTIKQTYYTSREFMNTGEKTAIGLNIASTALDASIAVGYILAGGLKAIPNFIAGASGFGGSPHVTIDIGGKQFGDAAEIAVKTLSAISHALDKGASIANTLASYTRRMDDWKFQAASAGKELENIDKQISGAELKIKIAENELKNHDLQTENAREVDEFMHSKYTNLELYQWMITQISQVYFQSYQLAYDLAKRAEKCYQFELGTEKTFLQFGYWDSLKMGLLSGEKLQYGLRRLENAYFEQNRREFELSKHVSLALTHPAQLLELKEKGRCVINLPEELFDFDYQGHYFRRVKSVTLSIPCVAGPYTTVNATLRLLKNEVRISSSLTGGYVRSDDSDLRFRTNPVGITAVATSTAQNDSGVFELNFKDDRYLPFEGAGAVSTWSIELVEDQALRQFDYNTISDVLLHMKYTAREDVGSFKNEAVKHLKAVVEDAAENTQMPLMRLFDVKHEFPNEYHAFKQGGAGAVLKLMISKDRFPFFAAEAKNLVIKKILVLGRFDTTNTTVLMDVENSDGVITPQFELVKTSSKFGEELKYDARDIDFAVGTNDEWKFSYPNVADLDLMSDLYVVAVYGYSH